MTETVNMPQLAPRDRCTGCGACSSGCPKGAIHMVPDREGFLYPEITDGCVQCGHCAHVCPVQKQREHRTAPQVFAVWSRDGAVRQPSTCGGAFSALAEYVLEGGGVVFGAALDNDLRVVHTAVKNVHELHRLRGSKPVQSDMGDAYQQVRLYLDQGRQVLFSGTPCQVDGLYRYLGEHPERLLTCDVACGGVCSPGVWAQLVKSMAYVKQHRPTAVEFCGKLTGDRERRFRVQFEGGGRYDAPMGKCELGRGIARRLFMRPACHHCAYATTDRPGDVTLGDAFNIVSLFGVEAADHGLGSLGNPPFTVRATRERLEAGNDRFVLSFMSADGSYVYARTQELARAANVYVGPLAMAHYTVAPRLVQYEFDSLSFEDTTPQGLFLLIR